MASQFCQVDNKGQTNSQMLITDNTKVIQYHVVNLGLWLSVKPLKKDKMRRIFGVLMLLAVTFGTIAATSSVDPNSENGIQISPVIGDNLTIEISDQLVTDEVTVSVFSSIGKVVIQETLETGLNKLSIAELPEGEYTAVVRQNDEFKSKETFEVK